MVSCVQLFWVSCGKRSSNNRLAGKRLLAWQNGDPCQRARGLEDSIPCLSLVSEMTLTASNIN